MNSPEDSSIDKKLDKHLASQPIKTSESFVDETMERIDTENVFDEKDAALDTLFASMPVQTSAGFTDSIIASCRKEKVQRKQSNLSQFFIFCSGAIAATLLITSGTFLFKKQDNQRHIADTNSITTPLAITNTNVPTDPPGVEVSIDSIGNGEELTTTAANSIAGESPDVSEVVVDGLFSFGSILTSDTTTPVFTAEEILAFAEY